LANHQITNYPIKKTSVAVGAVGGNPFIIINGELDMLDRPKLSKTPVIKEAVLDVPIGQGKQSLQQFQLKVDGQMKDSFATFETAEKTGLKIKTAHPVVQVSVYDSVKGAKTIITPGNAG
jgi:hypothetical protein